MLLNPCAVVRVDEDSSLRVLDDSLLTPRVELLAGSAVVDIPGIRKGSIVQLKLGGATVEMARKGTFRVDFSPPVLKVFDGRAAVNRGGEKTVVPVSRMVAFDSPDPEKFDTMEGDSLDLWNHQRALVLARARHKRQLSMAELAAAADVTVLSDASARGGGTMDAPVFGTRRMGSAPDGFSRAPLDMGCKF